MAECSSKGYFPATRNVLCCFALRNVTWRCVFLGDTGKCQRADDSEPHAIATCHKQCFAYFRNDLKLRLPQESDNPHALGTEIAVNDVAIRES